MGVVFFPSCLPFMGVMLFLSFALGNVSGEGGASLVPFSPLSFFLSLPLLSSPSPYFSFSLSSFLLFFHISFSLFPFLPHNSFHHFFFFSSFPPLSFPSPSFFFSSSLLLISISFSFPFFFLKLSLFFFFLREPLVLCASKM